MPDWEFKGRPTTSGTVQGAFGPTRARSRDSHRSVNLIAYWTKPQRGFWNFESQSLNNSTSDSKDSISKSGHVLRMRSKFLSGNASGMIFPFDDSCGWRTLRVFLTIFSKWNNIFRTNRFRNGWSQYNGAGSYFTEKAQSGMFYLWKYYS